MDALVVPALRHGAGNDSVRKYTHGRSIRPACDDFDDRRRPQLFPLDGPENQDD